MSKILIYGIKYGGGGERNARKEGLM